MDQVQYWKNGKEMKTQTFLLSKISRDRFFSPIRNRLDIVILLLESIRIIINNITISENKSKGKMVFQIDKMSRLFFFSERKYFSVNFPFFIDNNPGGNIVYDKNHNHIDSRVISKIMELFLGKNILSSNSLTVFFDLLEDIYEEKDIWNIIIELLTFEEGYIRFDNDNDHISEFHPQYHIDVCYKESNKIKMGLKNAIAESDFFDLLDSKSSCYFLNKNLKIEESARAQA
jgi:hypothetical protein